MVLKCLLKCLMFIKTLIKCHIHQLNIYPYKDIRHTLSLHPNHLFLGSSQEDKEQFVAFLGGKVDMTLEKKQGLASYEIISEEISEDGASAVVVANITYGDGSSKEDKMKLIKNAEGEWKISMDK